MYRFQHYFIMTKYPEAKLLFNDTDSFCHHIPTESDLYDDIRKQYWFDFSNYVEDHPNYDASNKLVPGKFKNKIGGKLIEEFVGLSVM